MSFSADPSPCPSPPANASSWPADPLVGDDRSTTERDGSFRSCVSAISTADSSPSPCGSTLSSGEWPFSRPPEYFQAHDGRRCMEIESFNSFPFGFSRTSSISSVAASLFSSPVPDTLSEDMSELLQIEDKIFDMVRRNFLVFELHNPLCDKLVGWRRMIRRAKASMDAQMKKMAPVLSMFPPARNRARRLLHSSIQNLKGQGDSLLHEVEIALAPIPMVPWRPQPQGGIPFLSDYVTLKSGGGREFELPEEVAMLSDVIRDMIEVDSLGTRMIQLWRCEQVLAKLVEYCETHAVCDSMDLEDELRVWDLEFIKIKGEKLYELGMAAVDLEIKGLADLVFQNVKKVSPEEEECYDEESREYMERLFLNFSSYYDERFSHI